MDANTNQFAQRKWLNFILLSLFFFYQFIMRVFPGTIYNELKASFSITCTEFGTFAGMFYVFYALVHLPLGILIDKIGPRLICSLSILLCSLGILPLLLSNNWLLCIIGRGCMGAGSAASIIGVIKIINLSFPPTRFATLFSYAVFFAILGAIYGGNPLLILSQMTHWTVVAWWLFGIGLILAVLIAVFIPSLDNIDKNFSLAKILDELKVLFTTRFVLSTSLLGGLMIGSYEGFADLLAARFLIVVHNFTRGNAALVASSIFLFMAIGCPILAHIADKTNSHKFILRLSAIILAIMFSLLLSYELMKWHIYIIFAIIGLCSSYQVLVIYINNTRVSQEHIGIISAFTNMIMMTFGMLFHFVFGKVLDYHSASSSTHTGFKQILYITIGCLIFALVGYIIEHTKEKYQTKYAN